MFKIYPDSDFYINFMGHTPADKAAMPELMCIGNVELT